MKILFAHGLASSGRYKMADSLRILLKPAEVLSPDLPIRPAEALAMLEDICTMEEPDLVVGLSLGGFLSQKLRGRKKLLVNPDFHPSDLLSTMYGEQAYLSPRSDGAVSFMVDEALCEEYRKMEEGQFQSLGPEEIALTTGLFADSDELVHCGPEFEEHYPGRMTIYPGGHLPDYPQIKKYFLPVINRL